jgi:hypothetical protein
MKTSNSPVSRGLSNLERPRFSPGLLLEDEDLTAGVDYTRNLMRLMFSSLFGCGVICGLKVSAQSICEGRKLRITVVGGLALDCAGNPINVPKPVTIEFDPECKPMPPKLWVTACYIEKCCRRRDISCSPDDDSQPVYTRTIDGYEIKLDPDQPECACSCAEPPEKKKPESGGQCCQDDADASTGADTAAPAGADTAAPDDSHAELHRREEECKCYDDHNKGVCPCGCGCTCVVIGVIDVQTVLAAQPAGSLVEADDSMVRNVRPMLMGYWNCITRPRPADEPGTEPEPAPGPEGDGGRPEIN